MALTVFVLQIKIETARIAQLRHRRRREGESDGVLDLHQGAEGAARYGLHAALRGFTFLPILQQHETDARILAAAAEAETTHRENGFDRFLFAVEKIVLHLFERLK